MIKEAKKLINCEIDSKISDNIIGSNIYEILIGSKITSNWNWLEIGKKLLKWNWLDNFLKLKLARKFLTIEIG